MMIGTEAKVKLGDYVIFGYSTNYIELEQKLSTRLGIRPRVIDFGSVGCIFFYSSYGDITETEETIGLKLGFARTPTRDTLTIQDLIVQKSVSPNSINPGEILGNALIACFSKTDPEFLVYKTLIAVPQLYYFKSNSCVICSNSLRCIVDVTDGVELNENALPMHFLFRSIPGELTYFRNINRLLPGQLLRWKRNELAIQLVRNMRFTESDLYFPKTNKFALKVLNDSLADVIADYIMQISDSHHTLINLLSGGVDSSIIQFFINKRLAGALTLSISYAPRSTPSFEFEIQYAKEASQFFETTHTFVDIFPEDYPGLLSRTIDTLAQPPVLETEPCTLAIAEFAEKTDISARYFFSGQGADGLFGLAGAKKLKALNYLSRIPGSTLSLKGLGNILKPVTPHSQKLLKGAEILANADNPHAFISPSNTIAVYSDLDMLSRCFGEKAIQTALEYRRDFVTQFSDSKHYLEKVYLIDLLTDAYEVNVQRNQLFLAHQREQVQPFLDEDVIKVGFAFDPDIRYIKGFDNKHLLKRILEQNTGSPIARKPKGFSIFENDLYEWMRVGPLHPLVQEIERPGFLFRSDFHRLLQEPSYFLWSLLVFDMFQKQILKF